MTSAKIIQKLLILSLSVTFMALPTSAAEKLPHPDSYMPHPSKAKEIIRAMDDPTDKMVTLNPEKMLPPEIWKYLVVDEEEAKKLTEEIVGFKSTDLAGKVVPEIKPGKYTYNDLERLPGLKELFAPEMLIRIKPGGPPLIGNIPEFEIIPTRQVYWFTRFAELTKKNLGKTKLDKEGYIIPASWEGGIPFPKLSGKFRAQQLYYNFDKRFGNFDQTNASRAESFSFGKDLKMDKSRFRRD